MNNFLAKMHAQVMHRVSSFPEINPNQRNIVDFCTIFQHKPSIIAEIKFARPNYGRIYPGVLSVDAIAEEYMSQGASALSVLTEPSYFQGDISYISSIRTVLPNTPILMKDFILSEKQIAQGLLHGANAILLIVAFLTPPRLEALYAYALNLGLTPVIEVHNQQELNQALKLSPKVIGINNRNLENLSINLGTSRDLIRLIPERCFALCESGIHHKDQIQEMQALGFDGFLIGSHLMHHEHPGVALHELF